MSKLHKGGRPPKKKTERLNIVMSDTEYLNTQRAAEIMGVSMAEVIRDGVGRVIRHLKSQGKWVTPEEEELQTFDKLAEAYKKKFGERIVIEEPDGSMQDMIPAIRKCLETNTPYEYRHIPPGCKA